MLDIKSGQFEGPLAVLLKMIEQEEMDITKVSLAKIADQYVNYIRIAPSINPEETADFLVVAARLLLIKSKALLPYLRPEEEEDITEFEQQLKIYKEFLQATKAIETIINQEQFMFPRQFNLQSFLSGSNIFSPPRRLSAPVLRETFLELIGRLSPTEKLAEKKLEAKVSIEEKIAQIKKILTKRLETSLKNILGQTASKTEMIVSFLAMLELVKQHQIVVKQDSLFKDIFITNNN